MGLASGLSSIASSRVNVAAAGSLQLASIARMEPKCPFSRQGLRDQLITLLVGGHKTTSNLLAWAVQLLATHPEERAVLEAEIQQHFEVDSMAALAAL